MKPKENIGVLLVNTGSPDSPDVPATRRYLRQFLSDARVIDMAPIARWLLLNLVILPFRPKHSAQAYRQVWTDKGSPLIVYCQEVCDSLRERLPDATIEIAMAYGNPSLPDAMDKLIKHGVARIVIVPLFPQYASATVGSVLELAYTTAARKLNVPALSVVPPYYNNAGYLDAWAEVAGPALDAFNPDYVVMSFHGLPERHIRNCDDSGSHCLQRDDCCDHYLEGNPSCYRAHCLVTAKGIAQRLRFNDAQFKVAFQSRLGRDPWLTPATDTTVVELAKRGIQRLAVLSPAFVADCLETLEEIGLRAKEDFIENGGSDFLLVPSLNSNPLWVKTLAALIEEA